MTVDGSGRTRHLPQPEPQPEPQTDPNAEPQPDPNAEPETPSFRPVEPDASDDHGDALG